MLYPLSYGRMEATPGAAPGLPKQRFYRPPGVLPPTAAMVVGEGFEPPLARGVNAALSRTELTNREGERRDSNARRPGPQPGALTS